MSDVATRSRRPEILRVSLELFASQGYEKTSLRDIAERLGFTKAALYYHYRTKEALLADLFGPVIAAGDAIVADNTEMRTRATRRAFLVEYFDHLWRHRALLCHVACDVTVLSATAAGAPIARHVAAVIGLLAPDSDAAGFIVAKAALGALQGPITLADPGDDVEIVRDVAVDAALAVLSRR